MYLYCSQIYTWMHLKHVWTVLISITAGAFICLTLVNTTIDQNVSKPKKFDGNIKNIVAYSLLKQIEIESEQYVCNEQTDSTSSVTNGSDVVQLGDEDNVWINVGDLHVFSIHVDRRLEPYHFVRIIGMVKGNFQETLFCQIPSIANTVYVTKVTITPIWLDIWGQDDNNTYFNPVLLSCRIPFGLIPNTVSLTTKPCDSEQGRTFQLPNKEIKGRYEFTVCVKPLNFFEDISERLVQWIEINRILGAEKIEIYVKKVKKKVWRILKRYNSTYPHQIVVRKFNIITESTANQNSNFSRALWQKRRYEVAIYNSCFYRNIETSQYVIPLDIDEIIVPKQVFTWKNLIRDVFTFSPKVKDHFASLMVSNAYFFGKFPKGGSSGIFFLKNTMRSHFSPAGESGKSFISTKNALTVFNHYALDILKPGVSRMFFLPSTEVQLNHYKESCDAVILPECVKYISSPRVKDFTIFKYEKVFTKAYLNKISTLKKSRFIL